MKSALDAMTARRQPYAWRSEESNSCPSSKMHLKRYDLYLLPSTFYLRPISYRSDPESRARSANGLPHADLLPAQHRRRHLLCPLFLGLRNNLLTLLPLFLLLPLIPPLLPLALTLPLLPLLPDRRPSHLLRIPNHLPSLPNGLFPFPKSRL